MDSWCHAFYYGALLFSIICLNLHCTSGFGKRPMIKLTGGHFQMGTNASDAKNGESPAYASRVKQFYINRYPVTIKEFQAFVKSKKRFLTDAESRGWSYVFKPYAKHINPAMLRAATHHDPLPDEPWMLPLIGASWRKPLGPGSNISHKIYHPVTHISKRDARAYCFWKGMRLPSEYEYEFAARGGLKGFDFPWGESFEKKRANLWQGGFPINDTAQDGFEGTNPVDAFPAQNEYDMHDLFGNVWEWTGTQWHIGHRPEMDKWHHFVLKGASHLESKKGTTKSGIIARVSSRIGRILHYSGSNVGFRCAKDVIVPKKDKKKKKKKMLIQKRPKYYFHSEL